MAFHWLLTVAAFIVAGVSLAKARRVSKKLERLTETYWELRYDHGQLRARVSKLDPETAPAEPKDEPAAKPANFVPLSSLRR